MKMKLLIATKDNDYAELLSTVLSEKYTDTINVSICTTAELLRELLAEQCFDVALLEMSLIGDIDLRSIHLPLLLWTETEPFSDSSAELKKVRKYQRISSLVSNILESYSKVSTDTYGPDSERAYITAVWSPSGGVGKTTVALAYAKRKAADGKHVLYLDLESFSSTPAYFTETGKSISSVFEMLEKHEGSLKMMIRSIIRQDAATGVKYFCRPENFDDMNILSMHDITVLINACAEVADELVIDMSCTCDERNCHVFELADRIFLVTDASVTTQVKLRQFASQHNVFESISAKSALVANRGAAISDPLVGSLISLPLVQSADASAVYKILSDNCFEGEQNDRTFPQ